MNALRDFAEWLVGPYTLVMTDDDRCDDEWDVPSAGRATFDRICDRVAADDLTWNPTSAREATYTYAITEEGQVLYGGHGRYVPNDVSSDAHRVAALADEELRAWDEFISDVKAKGRHRG